MGYFFLFTFLTLLFLVKSSNGEAILAKTIWDDYKKICDHNIQDLSESLRAEMQNQVNKTFGESNKRTDILIVSYDNFRCCLKKTWVEEIIMNPMQVRCMQQLMDCIVEAQKNHCTLRTSDYLLLTFSHYGVGTLVLFTLFIIATSCYVCCQLQKYYAQT